VRSGRSTRICSWNGRYLWVGMPEGCCMFFMGFASLRQMVRAECQTMTSSATRRP
jgi:hypothetical protein